MERESISQGKKKKKKFLKKKKNKKKKKKKFKQNIKPKQKQY